MRRIYLDYAACHPLLPEVKERIALTIEKGIWNPSSTYYEGRFSKNQIDLAREVLSESLGCLFGEIIFCSSGTESVNMALIGVALAYQNSSRKKILISGFEHPCALEAAKTLTLLGYKIELLKITPEGMVDLDYLQSKLDENVLLISVMHANNEIGTVQPINEIVRLAKEKNILVHTDAAQTFLQSYSFHVINWKIDDLGVDLLSISGHKIGALTGIGALYIRSGVKIEPLIQGGGQERDMRGGTENLLGIISLREAIKNFGFSQDRGEKKLKSRKLFLDFLMNNGIVKPIITVPNLKNTLPGHLHIRFPNIWADSFLIRLDHVGVCASSGSACSSGSLESSHVLKSIGFNDEEAKQGIRFTFGSNHTEQEIQEAALRVCQTLKEITNH